VPAGLRDDAGEWVGVSGRSRVVAYNTETLTEADLPASILEFTDPKWSGKIGWAPTNGSFQAFVTALRVLIGEDGARAWLEGIKANGAVALDNNIAVVEAVASGEIQVGFVNHYYLYQFLADDPAFPVANKIYGNGDPGALVNVAGVGILDTADHEDAAEQLVDFLLSADAQTYFAEETFEIPLAAGVAPHEGVPTLDQLQPPDIDLNNLDDLAGTLELLAAVGLV
jgi:iron(III) transport system substrate-binding protein